MKELKELIRPNIWSLKPYSSARDEYKGATASVFLDANENPYNPLQTELKTLVSRVKNIGKDRIFLGNGSDEAIDILYRTFCIPGVDNAVAIDPTYGMYEVCADINDVEYRKVLLDENFQFKASDLLAKADDKTKLIFLCSPNNPTGNNLCKKEIETVLQEFGGIVVIDEAYIDFSDEVSFTTMLDKYPNMVVLQTFSKAWGCAGIRLGMAFASEEIISVFNKVKYPYNVNHLTQTEAINMIGKEYQIKEWVKTLLTERSRLIAKFGNLDCCEHIYPTDANFFLAKVTDAKKIYDYLVNKGIIVRNRTNVTLCHNCLRVTIGSRPENDKLIEALENYK